MNNNHPEIPLGIYCYGRDGSGKRVVCPHWEQLETRAGITSKARCNFLNVISEYPEYDNLIWDQVKECGVNEDREND